MTSMECRICGEMIADLESAPRDSMGAYCEFCDMGGAVENALHEMVSDCEGYTDAPTFLRLLAKEGFAVTKVKK